MQGVFPARKSPSSIPVSARQKEVSLQGAYCPDIRRSSRVLAAAITLWTVSGDRLLAQKPASQPGSHVIAFTHDGEETDGYVLYARTSPSLELQFDLGRLEPVKGSVQATLPDLQPGTYLVTIAAYRGSRQGPRSAPLSIRVTGDRRVQPGPVRKGIGQGDLSVTVPAGQDPGRRSTPPGRFVRWLWRVIAG